MRHTIIYHRRFELNFERLRRDKENFKILRPEGRGFWELERPSEKIDGVIFGNMEKSQEGLDRSERFFAVRVEDMVLEHPVQIIRERHTGGKGFGPRAPHFGDMSAKRLLKDIIRANPDQCESLLHVYHNYFGRDREVTILDPVLPQEIEDDGDYHEGAVKHISVNRYERDPQAREACIGHYGAICAVCGFRFSATYGEVGEGVIHVHHLTPLSEVGEEYKVDPIEDLRPVCPNCHAIIHKRTPPYTIEEVQEFLAKAPGT